MYEMLRLQFIIFSLIGIGCYARKTGIVGPQGQKNITDLVIRIVLPCNIVTSFVMDIDKSVLYDCVCVFVISAVIQLLCFLYGKYTYRKIDQNRKTCLRYGLMISNAGFLGNPVAQGIYGDMGLMLASVYLTPVRTMMWSEGIALFSGIRDRKHTLKKVFTHPCVIACILGITIMVVKIFTGVMIVPPLIQSLLQTVGRCNTALSMMVIGMIVSHVKPEDFLEPIVFRYSVERLILIPAVVAALLIPLQRMGFISETISGLCVILAAMPAATTTSMLSSKYNCAPEFSANMVIVSTILSIPTIFIWSLILAV